MSENGPEIEKREDDSGTPKARKWVTYVILVCFVSLYVWLLLANVLVFFGYFSENHLLSVLLTERFAAVMGVPSAALMAFAVVWSYRTIDGAIKLNFWGAQFEGAAGPIIMWVFVFFSAVTGIAILY